jgi:hypothetical protein
MFIIIEISNFHIFYVSENFTECSFYFLNTFGLFAIFDGFSDEFFFCAEGRTGEFSLGMRKEFRNEFLMLLN